MKDYKKVAVCIPSTDEVKADFCMCLAALCFDPGAALALINNKGSIVPVNRNNGVDLAMEYGCDYVMFLDSDLIFPRDTLKRLLAHKKDIVGATYTKRVPPFENLAVPLGNMHMEVNGGLARVNALPGGCLLISMEVFRKMTKPFFHMPLIPDGNGGQRIQGEDYYFCEVAHGLGFDIWMDADLSMDIGHVGQQVFRIPANERSAAA